METLPKTNRPVTQPLAPCVGAPAELNTSRGRHWRSRAVACLLACLSAAHAQDINPLDNEPAEVPPIPRVAFRLAVPAALQVPSCDGAGVLVRYPAPFVVTDCLRSSAVTCEPPSGNFFPLGPTLVNCTALTDCGERATASFTVSVIKDGAPPKIECLADLVSYSTDGQGVLVDYALPVLSDDADPSPRIECSPAPGSLFPIGSTKVTCVATDACGQESSCSFVVDIKPAELLIRKSRESIGGRGSIEVTSVGLAGLDYCDALDQEWHPVEGPQLRQLVDESPTRFYRPPILEGVLRQPLGEMAYVSVGPLKAYANPGIELKRLVDDDVTSGGQILMAGNLGGSANRWSDVFTLPFTFRFYGRPYKKFRVSKNGLLTFSTNIVTELEGLGYFNFSQGTDSMTDRLPLWNAGFNVDNTIFCMAGRYVQQDVDDRVTSFTYGQAPHRQVWVLYYHPKDLYGQTRTAIVLEEGSNRIYLVDMSVASTANTFSRLLAGVQGSSGSTREVCQVPAAPWMGLVGNSKSMIDNGCYLFRPYVLGQQVSGLASPKLMAATNLDLLITERLRQVNLPGATVAVSRDGRMIFNKAYGFANVEKSALMKPYHRACIGSVSKVLAAIGIEKLVEQEKIPSLDAWAYGPSLLGKSWFWAGVEEGVASGVHFLFGVPVTLNTISNITLRHLLSHTSGFSRNFDGPGAAQAYAANGSYSNLTAQQQIRWFMASKPLAFPGVALGWRYSNAAFAHLGVLIEEVGGQPFEEWMQQNLLEPAGVLNMRLLRTWESQETWRDARRYYYYSTNLPWANNRFTGIPGPLPYDNYRYDNAADGGAGSWTATAADLCRLLAALDGLPNRPEILGADSIAELESVPFPAVSMNQPHGWDPSPADRVAKGGAIGFGAAQLIRSKGPERLTVAVVCNSQVGASGLANDVYNAVAEVPTVEETYDLFSVRANFQIVIP